MKSKKEIIYDIIRDISAIKHRCVNGRTGFSLTGVTQAQDILLRMVYGEDELTSSKIAKILSVSKSAVTQIALPLIQKGYLARKVQPFDKRTQVLSITLEGQTLIKSMQAKKMEKMALLFEGLDEIELETYWKLNQKIINKYLQKENDA